MCIRCGVLWQRRELQDKRRKKRLALETFTKKRSEDKEMLIRFWMMR